MQHISKRTFYSCAVLMLMAFIFSILSSQFLRAKLLVAQETNLVYLPVVLNNAANPVNGVCPNGLHLVNRATGAPDIVHFEDSTYADSDYFCAGDESCDDFESIATGTCQEIGGVVGYQCNEGFAGDRCQYCAPDYELNLAGDSCVPETPPSVAPPVVTGHFDAVEQGHSRTLRATGTNAASFVWEIVEGPGCFDDPAGGCGNSVIGETAVFVAPAIGDDIMMTDFKVGPPCCGDPMPPAPGVIITMKPNGIPVNGYGNSQLVGLLRVLNDFMLHRCIGAATVGVSYYGEVVGVYGLGRMDGRAAEDGWDSDCGNDPYVASTDNVHYDTPQTIGSNSKAVTNAIARWVVRLALEDKGVFLTDDEIEDLLLFGDNPGLPADFQFFSNDLHDLYSGVTSPPIMFPDKASYGDAGETLCDDLSGSKADPAWLKTTFGDLLAHSTGQQKNPLDYNDDVVPNLDAIRSLSTEEDYQSQDQVLQDLYGSASVDDARNLVGLEDIYFVPQPTVHEMLIAQSGRCLRHLNASGNGTYKYANADQWYLDEIVRYLYPSGLLMAENGFPETHEDSALEDFFIHVLNQPSSSNEGIFRVQAAYELGGYVQPIPARREWDVGQGTNYFWSGDWKRPFCQWSGNECSFSYWNNNPAERINWRWEQGLVPFNHTTPAISGSAGGLATESETYLKFMNNYWVGGYAVGNPTIGQERNNNWSRLRSHTGAYDGTFSHVIQTGWLQKSNPSINLRLPPLTPQGRLTDVYQPLTVLEPVSCVLPDGLDIIVSINQWGDKKCEDGNYCTYPNTDPAIGVYGTVFRDVIYYGLCQANWAALTLPELP